VFFDTYQEYIKKYIKNKGLIWIFVNRKKSYDFD